MGDLLNADPVVDTADSTVLIPVNQFWENVLPLGHAALAYLLYVGYARVSSHRLPARWLLIPLLFANQLPDLIDKPLAYWGILYSGRSFGHSIFTLLVFAMLVYWCCANLERNWTGMRRFDIPLSLIPAAFTIGYASHLLGDAIRPVLAGDLYSARFLLWPIFPLARSTASDVAPWVRMLRIYQDMGTHPQIELIVLAVGVFVGLRVRTGWRGNSVEYDDSRT